MRENDFRKTEFRDEINNALYQSAPLSLLSIVFGATLLTWVLYGADRTKAQVIWYYCFLGVIFIRILMYIWYQLTKNDKKLYNLHYYLFVISIVVIAAMWGASISVLMSTNVNYQLIAVIIVSGTVAAATLNFITSWVITSTYIILSLLPMIIWLSIQLFLGNNIRIYGVLLAVAIVYFIAMLIFSYYVHGLITGNIILKLKNIELFKNVSTARSQLELINRNLMNEVELNKQLQLVARRIGMADVAASVLHNVGNVLNSVNISVQFLIENFTKSALINHFAEVNTSIKINDQSIIDNVDNTNQLRKLVSYLELLEKEFRNENTQRLNELRTLDKSIQHIIEIVSMQRTLGGVFGLTESVLISEAIEDAIRLVGFDSSYIIERTYAVQDKIMLDKIKLMQILVNFIRNAKDSLMESNRQDKKILLSCQKVNSTIYIHVRDNGVGIKNDNLVRIFSFGFTTKKKGHGFGLHTSSLIAKEMGGDIKVKSAGPGQGAEFILELPVKS